MRAGPDPSGVVDDLLARVERRRTESGGCRSAAKRRRLGQFFTPRAVAERIAAQPRLDHTGGLSILDPGAGSGMLTAALVARLILERTTRPINVTAIEVDQSLCEPLSATLEDCKRTAAALGTPLNYEVMTTDFISWGTDRALSTPDSRIIRQEFDIIVQNPPYGKLPRSSPVRDNLALLDLDAPNLYSAFLALSAHLLAPGGQLVAITPRSFCNGTYFRSFRRDLLHTIGIDRICVFNERDTLFADSSVLQETVIFSGTRGGRPEKTSVATARGCLDTPYERLVRYEDIVTPGDPEMFLRIPTDIEDDNNSVVISKLPASLTDLGCQVSTGRVVDFRATDHLRAGPEHNTVPLIYPHHFKSGRISWPSDRPRKANAIVNTADTKSLLLPGGTYVLVKRLSSKEEVRRVVASVCRPEDVAAPMVGFENHLNVFHSANDGLDPHLATGLAVWLNSSCLDLYFRQFSGHTQVNATDLRSMRYPDRETLLHLGRAAATGPWPDQDEIDRLVERAILGHDMEGAGAIAEPGTEIVSEARELLRALSLDAERSNERSALVLLALAHLRPGQPWAEASNPLLRTAEIMDFLREHHRRDYKPSTRETIRRQTLRQFADAGLLEQNPDQPDRSTDSPRWCYRLTDRAITVIRSYQTEHFSRIARVSSVTG